MSALASLERFGEEDLVYKVNVSYLSFVNMIKTGVPIQLFKSIK